MTRIEEFIKYLESKLGNVYVWGAQGQVLSSMDNPEAWIKRMEQKNGQSYVNRALAFYGKVKATGKNPIEAFDCSGLGMYFFQNLKGWIKYDSNANGLYNICQKITSPNELKPGDMVFIYSKLRRRMTHIGYYIGNGYTIEAFGRDLGVVKRKLSQGKWTHYGRFPLLQVDAPAETKPVVSTPEWTVSRVLKLLDPYMRGDDVKALQTALNAAGFNPGTIDGVFGAKTETAVQRYQEAKKLDVDGKAGKYTITALGGKWGA